ncbi:lytic transglycosylase domain-containing protein [Duganella sp. BJB476]|uniref:transglycosylase SLT domain-containing protein n=1 Tax=Duganella sp. BJB476 TaxID=1871176 RepID=UPI000E350820|nr:lytic transglycosylase domain-containing protein [Duganella sp. BJB476]RFP36158.1 lytic transglycosylase domain-containing protein [Duganella sp. BJB476]
MKQSTIIAAAVVAAVVIYAATRPDGTTAGDDDSNIILDGIEDMNSIVSGWPTGSGPYQDTINDAADQFGVPAPILAWLLWKESRYSDAIITGAKRSRVGALGIAQFMPATAAQELGSIDAALDPDTAIPGAARYLAKLYRSAGSWAGALAAYNWGIGNVTRKGIDAAPPETVDYFTTILAKAGGNYA